MANLTPVVTPVSPENPNAGYLCTWTPVISSSTCLASPPNLSVYADRSVQIEGTFNGATVVMTGSNDGVNYQNLSDPQGTDISKAAADLEQIEEATVYFKPTHSGGGGSQSLTISVLCTGYRTR